MRILLIEQHKACARGTAVLLDPAYSTVTVVALQKALHKRHSETHDVMLLCAYDPSATQHIVGAIRAKSTKPLLVVCACTAEAAAIEQLLDAGADDYVVLSDVGAEELFARCIALVRRTGDVLFAETMMRAGNLVIDLRQGIVCVGKQRVQLTKTEYRICAQLLLSTTGFVSKEKLRSCLRHQNQKDIDHVVDVHIANLRRKLDGIAMIETVSCRGIQLKQL